MIEKSITERILLVGPDCDNPRGGIGMVTNSYEQLFPVFNYLTTQREGSTISKILVFAGALLKLVPYLCGKKIRVVHVHGSSDGSFYRKAIIIILSKLAGKKVIFHIHSGGFKDFTRKHEKAVRYILFKCDTVVALSDYWKEYYENDLGCKHVTVIPNIMEIPAEDHSCRKDPRCTFLFLGKVCDHKGLFDLLDVFQEHAEELRSATRLLIAGIGESDRLLSFIRTHQLEDFVEYKGWVEGDSKTLLLNQSDVFVLPSYYEGVPISLLEGFSYHLPAIATNVGGIPEILHDGENGILITPGDKDALYLAMKRLADSPSLRMEMGGKGHETSMEHLPCKVEDRLTKLYKQFTDL